MKSKADKLDVDKLVPVAPDLSKLSDAVEKDVSKNIYIYIYIYIYIMRRLKILKIK